MFSSRLQTPNKCKGIFRGCNTVRALKFSSQDPSLYIVISSVVFSWDYCGCKYVCLCISIFLELFLCLFFCLFVLFYSIFMFYFDFVFVLYIILFYEVIIIIIESVYILMRYRKKGYAFG